ncbi:LysR family transcriptional regulator [Bacillus sp. B15-48]|uniref:LysR family transcriptional regulator n=1 Tax=Bacillus sp. B15-48 TaxID=1548601 RepID=UPI00193FF849|nr:LysR family transcriptional regulator [Bacillus sp. B15-48]
MNINFNHLETFLAVYEYENFTLAARHLYIPQPTLTNRVNLLEKELGFDIFERSDKGKRTVKLSKAGKMFLPYAKQVVETFYSVQKRITAQIPPEKEIKIGTSITLNNPMITQKIDELISAEKNLNINLMYIGACSIYESLLKKKIDLAIVLEPLEERSFTHFPITTEDFHLFISPNHDLAKNSTLENISSLEGQKMIYYKPFETKLKVSQISSIHFRRSVVSNQLEFVKNLLFKNMGISFLPEMTFNVEINKGDLVQLPLRKSEFNFESISYYIAYRKEEEYYKDFFIKPDFSLAQFINKDIKLFNEDQKTALEIIG